MKDLKNILAIFTITLLLVKCSSIPTEYIKNDNCCYRDSIFNLKEEDLVIDSLLKKQLIHKGKIELVNNSSLLKDYVFFDESQILFYEVNKTIGVLKIVEYNGDTTKISHALSNGFTYLKKQHSYVNRKKISEIDYDKGYTICWQEALNIVKQTARNYIKRKNPEIYLSRVPLNIFPNEKPKWTIKLVPTRNGKSLSKRKFYEIDGETGKILKIYRGKIHYSECSK